MVGTAAGAGVDDVVCCANAVSGVAQSSRMKDVREILAGEKPAKGNCVVIDSGELRSASPSFNASHPNKSGTLKKLKMFHQSWSKFNQFLARDSQRGQLHPPSGFVLQRQPLLQFPSP